MKYNKYIMLQIDSLSLSFDTSSMLMIDNFIIFIYVRVCDYINFLCDKLIVLTDYLN